MILVPQYFQKQISVIHVSSEQSFKSLLKTQTALSKRGRNCTQNIPVNISTQWYNMYYMHSTSNERSCLTFANNSILSPHGWVCRLMRDSFSEEMGASTRQLQFRLKDTKNIRPLQFGQVCSELTPQTRSVCVLLPINRCATTNFSKRALFCHRLVIARR